MDFLKDHQLFKDISTVCIEMCPSLYSFSLHLSLSRNLDLKIFEIPVFYQLLERKLQGIPGFYVTLQGFSPFQSEDTQREFVAMNVKRGSENVTMFVFCLFKIVA